MTDWLFLGNMPKQSVKMILIFTKGWLMLFMCAFMVQWQRLNELGVYHNTKWAQNVSLSLGKILIFSNNNGKAKIVGKKVFR